MNILKPGENIIQYPVTALDGFGTAFGIEVGDKIVITNHQQLGYNLILSFDLVNSLAEEDLANSRIYLDIDEEVGWIVTTGDYGPIRVGVLLLKMNQNEITWLV